MYISTIVIDKLIRVTENGVTREAAELEIPVPWGQVSAKWWGPRDKQPILALHGWQDNAGTWDSLIPVLPSDIAVLAIDLPGHGFSSPIPEGMPYYLFWDGVVLLRRIVKFYNWKNITLMGHSLGGAISFLYAATFPDEVDRYISLDIASPSVRDIKKIALNTGNAVDTFLKYENLASDKVPCYDYNEMFEIAMSGYGGSITHESCKILLKRGMKLAPNKSDYIFTRDIRLKVARLGMFSIDHVLEYASNITCKVLNIKADPGMLWENPSYYNMVLDRLREKVDVSYHEVEGTHHVHLNEPEKIAGIITDFLKE